MPNKSIYLILSLLMFVVFPFTAQDPLFNQNDNSTTYMNPAFTGVNKSFSADLSYRNQWPEISGNYITTTLATNQYLGKGNGVSILYLNDHAGNLIVTNRIGAGYAKQFQIAKKHNFSIGVQAMYFNKTLNVENMTFGDQIDPRTGFVYPTSDIAIQNPRRGLDFNAGALYFNDFFFLGLSSHHLFEPNEGFFGNAHLPRKYSIQMGGKLRYKEITFIPFAIGNIQDSFKSLIVNLQTRYKIVALDIGYAGNNGLTGGLGLKFNSWNIGYNFGYNSSIQSQGNISAHELRIGFQTSLFKKTNDSYFDF